MPSTAQSSGHVLIVDDDSILATLYRLKLQAAGFTVDVAESGEAGLLAISRKRPDIVVLDLMLGDMNGVEVLKVVRSNHGTKDLPVVVFSSAFLSGLIEEATREGANRCLNKAVCPPNRLIEELHTILHPQTAADVIAPSAATVAPGLAPARPQPAKPPGMVVSDEVQGTLRRELLEQIDKSVNDALKSLPKWLANPSNVEAPYLSAIYRAVRAIAASARLAGRTPQSHLSGALEVLLQEIRRSPERISDSIIRTVAEAIELLPKLQQTDDPSVPANETPPLILVVDDDEDARDVLNFALQRAHLRPVCLGAAEPALRIFEWNPVDLAIVDLEMPGMDGAELVRRIRRLPSAFQTPVVFVSGRRDLEQVAAVPEMAPASFLPKPFPVIELAVKALSTLYGSRLRRSLPAAPIAAA